MIQLQSIHKQYGPKVLFENAEANLTARSRLALVGPNGAGKSTLIRMILSQEDPDSGSISKSKNLVIGYLAQEIPTSRGCSVLDEVMRLDGRREELLRAKQEMEQSFELGQQSDPEALERYGRILEEFELLDESRLEARAKEVLMGMGFQISDFTRPLNELSGGWLMRVALSRILVMEPDLLILDEPTNHLDLESLLWLEEFLGSFHGAMLLVSHDTAFLNRMVTEVIEINQRKLILYRGNFDAYLQQKAERLKLQQAQYEGQQAKIAELEHFISRFGAKATKARQAQSRVKQLDKMERIELEEKKATVRFRFPPAPHSGREIVTVKNAEFRYGPLPIFQNLNWTLTKGSRIAIVGVNGAGKSTLLKLLSRQIEPSSGEIKWGHEVKIGYYAQHQADSLNLDSTVLAELERIAPHLPTSQVRSIAGAFLFQGDAVEKKCSVLSGGEKARVALAKILLSPVNFLLLDEPTNHLDVDSREVLLEALQNFEGTLCLVSHDRSFVSSLVNTVLEIEPPQRGHFGARVHALVEDYAGYLARKVRETSEAAFSYPFHLPEKKGQKNEKIKAPKRAGPSNNQMKAWVQEREQIEVDISALEKTQFDIHTQLADQKTYNDGEKILKLVELQTEIQKNLSTKMARWEQLCHFIDQ